MSLSQEEALAAARDDIARADWLIGTSMDAMKLSLNDSAPNDTMLLATLARFLYENIELEFMPVAFAVAVLKLVRAEEPS